MPLVGGFVADRWLGSRKAIAFGALLLVAGHFTMAIEGPAASETLSYQGHAYQVRLQGRMEDRKVCLEVAAGCYAMTAAPDGGLAIKDLPAAAPLPGVLPKGTYVQAQARSHAFVDVLYLALALIIMGVGFLKANISSIVGQLYPQGDPRRDPGFTLYYYGINLGAFWASIVCGLVGQTVSWGAGFGLAGLGMLAGFLVFVFNKPRLEGHGEPPDPAALKRRVAGPVTLEWGIYLAAVAGVAVVWWLVRQYALMGWLLLAGWVAALGYLGWEMSRIGKVGRERLVLAILLVVRLGGLLRAGRTGRHLAQPVRRAQHRPAQRRLLDHHAGADSVVQRRLHPDLRAAAGLDLGQARRARPRPQSAGEVRPRPDPDRASASGCWSGARPTPDAAFRTPLFFLALLLPAADHRRAFPEPGRPLGDDQAGAGPDDLDADGDLVPGRLGRAVSGGPDRPHHGGRDHRRPGARPRQGARHLRPHLPGDRRLGLRRRGRSSWRSAPG